MKNRTLNYIVETFGFQDWSDYTNSAFHSKAFGLFLSSSLVISTINSTIEEYLGLKPFIVCGVIVLLLMELITGLVAKQKNEKVEDREFKSKKFSRFSLKAFMWTAWLFVVMSFRDQFIDTNVAAFELFDWVHTIILVYMFFEYLVSVDENYAKIKGKPNTLLQIIIKKFRSFLDIKELDNEIK